MVCRKISGRIGLCAAGFRLIISVSRHGSIRLESGLLFWTIILCAGLILRRLIRDILYPFDRKRPLGKTVYLIIALGNLLGNIVGDPVDIVKQSVLCVLRIADHPVVKPVEPLNIRLYIAVRNVAVDQSRTQFVKK